MDLSHPSHFELCCTSPAASSIFSAWPRQPNIRRRRCQHTGPSEARLQGLAESLSVIAMPQKICEREDPCVDFLRIVCERAILITHGRIKLSCTCSWDHSSGNARYRPLLQVRVPPLRHNHLKYVEAVCSGLRSLAYRSKIADDIFEYCTS